MKQTDQISLMTEGDYRIKILKFAVPVFFGNLFQVLYTAVDSIVVGNYLGPQALAAVSSNGALTSMMVGMFMGFGIGSSVVTGYAIGAEDRKRTQNAVHSSLALGILFGIAATIIGIALSRPLLELMSTPADVIDQSLAYVRIYFAGALALIVYNILTGIMQAAGNSRDPLKYLVISSILNIILDILFVSKMNMGISGAAFATVISETVSAILSLSRLMHSDDDIKVSLSGISFEKQSTIEIIRLGLPCSVQWTLIDLSNVVIQSYINSFGSFAMAGYGAAQKIEGFTFIPIKAMSGALTSFVSQNYGAHKFDRVKKGIVFGVLSGVLTIECIGTITFLYAGDLIALFNSDPEVLVYGMMRLHICSFFFGVLGFTNILSGALNSLGHSFLTMMTSLICWCAVRVTILNTVGRIWHHFELCCLVYPLTWSLSTAVLFIALVRIFRKELNERS